jgi:hypothetical protein
MTRKPLGLGLALLMLALWMVTTEARVPAEAEMSRIEDLALQLEIDTDEAYVEALHDAAPGDAREQEALHRLYTLMESALEFHELVQILHEDPSRTVAAFEQLNSDFVKAHEHFYSLRAYGDYRELFETIEDAMGNLRYYYVGPNEYKRYPDYKIYPYYPGFSLFVHIHVPAKPFHFRHVHYWHLHPKYHKHFPHRVKYLHGYGRYKHHYTAHARYSWHKKVVKPKPKPKAPAKPKPAPKPKPKPKPKSKPKPKRPR